MSRLSRVILVIAFCAQLFAAGFNMSRGYWWLVLMDVTVAVGVVALWVYGERRIRRLRAETQRMRAATQLFLDEMHAPRPQGVVVRRANGEVLPVELMYRGLEGQQHMWRVAGMVLRPGDGLFADMMPGHTGIEIERWIDDDDEEKPC